MFIGFAQLDVSFAFPVLTVDSSNLPLNSSTTPSYRVYGPTGLIASGSLSLKDTGAVTVATNASPIVVTSASHGLTTGMKVTVTSVLGNTAANGTFTITKIDADTFSLGGTTGNGPYTSGGTWNATGFYQATLTPSMGGGYASGNWYDVLVIATISGNVVEQLFRLGVV